MLSRARFPQLSVQVFVQSEIQCLQEKLIVTVVEKSGASLIFQGRYQGSRADSRPPKTPVHVIPSSARKRLKAAQVT